MGFETNKRITRNYNNKQTVIHYGSKVCHFRSKLEARVGDYLEMLKMGRHIKDWAYEQTTFTFKNIILKHYIMDFDILRNDGTFFYIEAKGMMDKHGRDRIIVLLDERPEVELWVVFSGIKDKMKFMRTKISRQCKRVCTISELTKGMV